MPSSVKLRSMVLIVLAAVVVVLGAVAATAGAAPTAKWIVFAAVPSGQHVDQLFRIRSSGAGLERLTKGPYPSTAPAFSPNGTRIAFARAGVGLVTMDLNGKALRRLTTNGRDSYPAWSPDGKQLAFVRPYKEAWSVFVMPSSGGTQRRLTKAPPSGRPTWSSGGLLIPSGGDLLKVAPTNGHVLKYFNATVDAVWGLNTVSIASDVSVMTYIGARDPEPGDKECGEGPCQRFALYKENLRTKSKTPRRVIKNVGPAAFSPDGRELAFFAQNARLQFWKLTTGRSTSISIGRNYATIAAAPAWQP